MANNVFCCIVCKNKTYEKTGKHPRDRTKSDIVICKKWTYTNEN